MTTQIFWISSGAKVKLGIMPRPRGSEQLGAEMQALREAGVDTVVSLLVEVEVRELELEEEPAECRKHGLDFRQFPVRDRQTPSLDFDTLTFLKGLAQQLEQEQSVVIHCRMGVGRASLIAAATMVLCGTNPDEAFDVIRRARGCDVPDTPEQREWVTRFAKSWRKLQPVDDLWLV
ncbi:tyrosine protein phosphatase [bacterium]|nr:MAG: tyrosine protein phosphatase [bacterium]